MKIISYNVNGIRAAMAKGLVDWLITENPDVISFQEIKALPEQIDISQFEKLGYYANLFSAQKKGYSGVATFSKVKPSNIEYGIGVDCFDSEGRLIRVDIGDLTLINSYFPSGSSGDERQDFKMEYLQAIQNYITKLKQTRSKIILSGDYNICHKPIDINHPERQTGVSGFLPEEREWVTKFIDSGFIDSFRVFDQSPEKYSWWSYRQNSREKNFGWRIDYHMVSESLRNNLKGASILANVVHSDHCPVVVEIE